MQSASDVLKKSTFLEIWGRKACQDAVKDWDSPDPEAPFSGKEGFGVQSPHFPSPSHGPEKGVFGPKI